MSSEKEMIAFQKAAIYDISRYLKKQGKENYTLEELLALLDDIADAKDQQP